MTVDEMLDRMSPQEFADWQAYDELYPIGDLRTEVEFARLKFLIVSALAGEDDGPDGIEDFLWSFTLTKKARDRELQKRNHQKILRAFGFSK